MHLLLEAELDKRVPVGGALDSVKDALPRPPPPSVTLEARAESRVSAIASGCIALLEGACVQINSI
jgi:hypothetical protein